MVQGGGKWGGRGAYISYKYIYIYIRDPFKDPFKGPRPNIGLLWAGIDACEKAASQSLARRAEPAMSHSKALEEAQGLLRKIDPSGEEVKAVATAAAWPLRPP